MGVTLEVQIKKPGVQVLCSGYRKQTAITAASCFKCSWFTILPGPLVPAPNVGSDVSKISPMPFLTAGPDSEFFEGKL